MGIFKLKNQFLKMMKQVKKILFTTGLVSIVLASLFLLIFPVSEVRAEVFETRPDNWVTDPDSTGYPNCDSGLSKVRTASSTNPDREILWTWKATKDGIGQIIGWDNDPVGIETSHTAYHFPDGVSNTNNLNNADWSGAPQTTPKSDDEHPYWSNTFLVTAGETYQMRPGGNSIWASFCFKEEVACSTTSCTADQTSGWPSCTYCDLNVFNTQECFVREQECRQRAISYFSSRHISYLPLPALLEDNSDTGRILWFNWAKERLSCGTSCGTGHICCPPIVPPTYDPWWQSSGGNLYSKGEIKSSIPIECVSSPDCSEYLINKNSDGDDNSAGIPISEAGIVDPNNGENSDRIFSAAEVINASSHNNIKEDYSHFIKKIDISNDTIQIGGIPEEILSTLPSGATPVAGSDTEVYYASGSLTLDFSSTQTVNDGTKKMIFVEGDLEITSDRSDINYIDVEQGGFLAFIVKGNININPKIGNSDPTSTLTNLEGVFVTDGTFNINGYVSDNLRDKKFIFEGTIAAWGGINLERDYGNNSQTYDYLLNSTNPIEVFIFRPDFHKNISTLMLKPNIIWQEVN